MDTVIDCAAVVTRIRKLLRAYLAAHKLRALVLGVSGGIDSATTAALAAPVCRETGVPLIGRSMPIHSNKPEEIERANGIGRSFCDDFAEVDLAPAFDALSGFILEKEGAAPDPTREKIRLGNIKARVRMIYLYNLACARQGMVLSTDNLTEFYLGFWTLHGDVGDYGIIQTLWKSEVYALAHWMAAELRSTNAAAAAALDACGRAVVTDGLGITASSLEQIGARDYDEVDRILRSFHEQGSHEFAEHPVVKRSLANAYKRDNPHNPARALLIGR